MATSMMMMYPAFETQHEQLPHQHYLNQYYMQQQQQQQQQRLSPVDATATATATMLAVPTVPEALRCQYSSKRCEHHRTNKKSGGLHKFCAVHREKANRNQMRLDHRRRVLKRLAQRSANGTPSSPSASSTSTISSPYTKKKRTTSRDGDDMLSIEDDLEIDLMPLALHRENNPHASASSELWFDPQDLHILETLLFSDDDASERKGQPTASATNKPLQRKKQKTTHTVVKTEDVSDSANAFGSWLLHL